MYRSDAAKLWATFAVALGGCGGDNATTSGTPASTVRDSAGVTIVENARPETSQDMEWVVAREPSLSLGALEGDDRYQFFRVVDALRLGDGRIVVANRGTSEIRLYDRTGQYLDAWGSTGEGPGEFTNLSLVLRWPGDSILAWDSRQRRVTVFDASGEVGRTFSFGSDEVMNRPEFVDVLADGSLLVAGSSVMTPAEISSGLHRVPRVYGRADRSGQILGSLGTHPGNEAHIMVSPEVVNVVTHPFARRTVAIAWGGTALISPSDRYELASFDMTGDLVRSVRLAHQLETVTDADLQAYVESRVVAAEEERHAQIRQLYEDVPLVETFPAFGEIHVDALDHLWVRDYRPPPKDPGSWTVFDPDGRVLGRIDTPPGLDVMEIGEDYILGRSTDELDVEYVQVWGLARR